MTSWMIVVLISVYFGVLAFITIQTSKNANTQSFFNANRNSPWLLVAIGMIGASLSGVTFISVPGLVGSEGANQAFSYMQMVIGYLIGYLIIATVLMPLYYKWNLTSIYSYLGERLGPISHKTAAAFFLISRSIGAALRLFLVAIILQKFVMEVFGIPFWLTVLMTIALIWVYTYKGGIKTIVWTDTIQTVTMITAVILTLHTIMNQLGWTLSESWNQISLAGYNKLFYFEGGWNDSNNFFKQFIAGMLIATCMTGLDQDMMQKNLTCRTLKSAQKNIAVFSVILVFANFLFLFLGAMLYLYATNQGVVIPESTDQLFPLLALQYLPPFIGAFFVIGLLAAAYSSADSALTSLTTSFCIDFLNFETTNYDENKKRILKLTVHIGFSILLFVIIMIVNGMNKEAIINNLFKAAGYTYGPLLGMFGFAIFSNRKLKLFTVGRKKFDFQVIPICIISILLTYILDINSVKLLNGFNFGHTILAVNGLLVLVGLLIGSKSNSYATH